MKNRFYTRCHLGEKYYSGLFFYKWHGNDNKFLSRASAPVQRVGWIDLLSGFLRSIRLSKPSKNFKKQQSRNKIKQIGDK